MTDKEIIKALECCAIDGAEGCKRCSMCNISSCFEILSSNALDLINRQQAEIERLQNDLAISRKETKRYATRRAEAIKEFAEIYTEKFIAILNLNYWQCEIARECKERIVKIMVGEQE